MSYEEKADSLKDSAEVVQVSELPASDYPDVKQTKRDLKPRHIQLIAISGAIGTGLFVRSLPHKCRF